MSGKHFRRAAGLVAVSAAAALVASAAYPAGAAAPGGQQQSAVAAKLAAAKAKKSSRTLLPARTSRVALDPSIAAVRGTDGGVWATTGSGFANLGGKVLGGPAVAADPAPGGLGVFFLAQGINGDLYLRTDSPDFPWRQVDGTTGPISGISDPTLAFDPAAPGTALLVFSGLDLNRRVVRGFIDPFSPPRPTVSGLTLGGPAAGGQAVSRSEDPVFTGDRYIPGVLGPYGTTYQWFPPGPGTTRLNLALSRAPRTLGNGYPSAAPYPNRGVIVGQADNGSVNYLGRRAVALGGRILNGPGVAVLPNGNGSTVFAVGTDNAVYAKDIIDSTVFPFFRQSGWIKLGGVATSGVQAAYFPL